MAGIAAVSVGGDAGKLLVQDMLVTLLHRGDGVQEISSGQRFSLACSLKRNDLELYSGLNRIRDKYNIGFDGDIYNRVELAEEIFGVDVQWVYSDSDNLGIV